MSDYGPGLKQCAACRHVCADLSLSLDEIREIYSAHYYQGDEYLDYAREMKALSKNFKARLTELLAYVPQGSSLFEIGCAYGFFLNVASRHFEVAGCDISEHAVDYARQNFALNARAGNYLEFDPPAKPFDLVCMWDTVEHLAEPHRFIEKVSRELRSGGMLALSTGDIGSLNARWRGNKWRLLHPPSHLHYFTVPSMRALLERNGMEIVKVFYPFFWRSFDAVAYRLCSPRPWTRRGYDLMHRLHLLDFSFPLNTFDLMTVYARKL